MSTPIRTPLTPVWEFVTGTMSTFHRTRTPEDQQCQGFACSHQQVPVAQRHDAEARGHARRRPLQTGRASFSHAPTQCGSSADHAPCSPARRSWPATTLWYRPCCLQGTSRPQRRRNKRRASRCELTRHLTTTPHALPSHPRRAGAACLPARPDLTPSFAIRRPCRPLWA